MVPRSGFRDGGQCVLGQPRLFMVGEPCWRENRWPRIESQTIPRTEVATELPTVDDGSTSLPASSRLKSLPRMWTDNHNSKNLGIVFPTRIGMPKTTLTSTR